MMNETSDPALLAACREEFHRRLKVYHAWKAKHAEHCDQVATHHSIHLDGVNLNGPALSERINLSERLRNQPDEERKQRYFKMPFILPHEPGNEEAKNRGMWYSHFDGKWIARQMEIFDDDKPAVLLLAGVDDMNMCELSLEETGLTQKWGAEILETEFQAIWNKNGGVKYLNDHFGQICSKYIIQAEKLLAQSQQPSP